MGLMSSFHKSMLLRKISNPMISKFFELIEYFDNVK